MKRAFETLALLLIAAALAYPAKNSCFECHSSLPGPLQAPAMGMPDDIHNRFGFSCAACHGGDPAKDDPQQAMNRARGFIGKPARTAIPRLCAHCHSDAALMHKYNPKQRVDQYAQYVTSIHGKRIAAGDAAAATCIDCHGVHGIREVKSPLAPVHPLRLPQTCAACHASARHMAKYGISTTQFDDYRKSVHWEALEKRGDLSAPSCASCHGNHGATPPGVASVANVCGSCHVLLENLFNKSPHQPVFASMGVGGCAVCHGNHEIHKPSGAMLTGPNAVCAQCHDAASAGGRAATEMGGLIEKLRGAVEGSRVLLDEASKAGMEVSEALLRQSHADETLVKARVAVHAFQVDAVAKPAGEGLGIAAETHRAGSEALEEGGRRRMGLGVSLILIVMTMAGLWVAIRRLEKRPG
jgi:hypothetical protein